MQDEATRVESKGGLPMIGAHFFVGVDGCLGNKGHLR